MFLLSWHSLVFLIPIGIGTALAIGAAFALGAGDADQPAGDAHLGDHDGADQSDAVPEVGRIPLTARLMLWSLTFGGGGLSLTYLLGGLARQHPVLATVIAAKVAVALVVLVDRQVARLVLRRVPLLETQTINRRDLLGSTGRAVLALGPCAGLVQVHDRRGNLHQVVAHTFDGEPALAAGADVLLVDYDPQKGVFRATVNPIAPLTTK
jgi:uncharacterized membrane protein YsdA (DUF1294 family)